MKTAIITGGSKGVGKAAALALAEDNYNLGLISRNEETLLSVKDELLTQYPGIQVETYAANVSNSNEIKQAVDFFKGKFNIIDVLFNNAGIFCTGSVDLHPSEYSDLVSTNQLGFYNVLRPPSSEVQHYSILSRHQIL
ncbi:SDR family NAD(P)-dependent oxidoreductase [Piscirickettsia salmonis]|uniref:SDR family NAD(P)-dependent oxidoreductase n=1 Tax=Piscirickettsia salmonis TaxID=1238 RepID=UPI003A80300A